MAEASEATTRQGTASYDQGTESTLGGLAKKRSQLPPPRVYAASQHKLRVKKECATLSTTFVAKGVDGEPMAKVARGRLPRGLPVPAAAALPRPARSPCESDPNDGDYWRGMIGARVQVGGEKLGTLLFYGATQFADGIWCGVRLEEPVGKNDGTVAGVRYFSCSANCGIFAPPHKVTLLPPPSPTDPPQSQSTPTLPCPARVNGLSMATSLPEPSSMSRRRSSRRSSLDSVADNAAANTFILSPMAAAESDTFVLDDSGQTSGGAGNGTFVLPPPSMLNGTVVLNAASPVQIFEYQPPVVCSDWSGVGYTEVALLGDEQHTDDDYSGGADNGGAHGGRQGSLDLDESLGILTPDEMRDFTVAPDAELLQTPSDEGIQELGEDELADEQPGFRAPPHQSAKDELFLPLRQQQPNDPRQYYEQDSSGTLTRETTSTFSPEVGEPLAAGGEWQQWTPDGVGPAEHGIGSEETPCHRADDTHYDLNGFTRGWTDVDRSPSDVPPTRALLNAVLHDVEATPMAFNSLYQRIIIKSQPKTPGSAESGINDEPAPLPSSNQTHLNITGALSATRDRTGMDATERGPSDASPVVSLLDALLQTPIDSPDRLFHVPVPPVTDETDADHEFEAGGDASSAEAVPVRSLSAAILNTAKNFANKDDELRSVEPATRTSEEAVLSEKMMAVNGSLEVASQPPVAEFRMEPVEVAALSTLISSGFEGAAGVIVSGKVEPKSFLLDNMDLTLDKNVESASALNDLLRIAATVTKDHIVPERCGARTSIIETALVDVKNEVMGSEVSLSGLLPKCEAGDANLWQTSTPLGRGLPGLLHKQVLGNGVKDSPCATNLVLSNTTFDKSTVSRKSLGFNVSRISMTSCEVDSPSGFADKVSSSNLTGALGRTVDMQESIHSLPDTFDRHELSGAATKCGLAGDERMTVSVDGVTNGGILQFVAEPVYEKTETGGGGGGMAVSITSIETGYQGDAECDLQSEMGTNAANTPIDDGSCSKDFKDFGRHHQANKGGGHDPGSDSDFYSDMGASWTESEMDGDDRTGNGGGNRGRGARVIDGRLYYRNGSCSKDADVSSLSNESLSTDEQRHRTAAATTGRAAVSDMPDVAKMVASELSESAFVPENSDGDGVVTKAREMSDVASSDFSFGGDVTVWQGQVVADTDCSYDSPSNATIRNPPAGTPDATCDDVKTGKMNGTVVLIDAGQPGTVDEEQPHRVSPEGTRSRPSSAATAKATGKQKSPSTSLVALKSEKEVDKMLPGKTAKGKRTTPEKSVVKKDTPGSADSNQGAAVKRLKTPKKNVMSKIKAMIEATSNKLTHKDAGNTPPSPKSSHISPTDGAADSKPGRTPKKSRWDAVMSKIAAGQESEKVKSKKEIISKVNSNLTSNKPTTAQSVSRSPRPETGAIPKNRSSVAASKVSLKFGPKLSGKPAGAVTNVATAGAKKKPQTSASGYSDLGDISINSRSEKTSSLMSNRGSKLPRSVSRPTTLSLGPPEAASRSSSQASILSAGSHHSTLSQLTLASHTSTRPPQDTSLASQCSNLSMPEDSRGTGTGSNKLNPGTMSGRLVQRAGTRNGLAVPAATAASRQGTAGLPLARTASTKYTRLDRKSGSVAPQHRLPPSSAGGVSSSSARAGASSRAPALQRRDRVSTTSQVGSRRQTPAQPNPNSSRPSKGKEPMRPPKTSNGLVKSGPQPDLLHSSAVNRNNNNVTREVSRLEFLCEARTKELNYVKLQLKHCALGFDSLSVLVQYLTQELGAFSVPDLKAELLRMQKKLQLAHEQLDQANTTQTCLRDELSKCHEDQKLAMEHLKNDLLNNLKETESRLNGAHHQEIHQLTVSHGNEKEELQNKFESRLSSLTESQKESEISLRADLNHQLETLKKEHENEITALRLSYEENFAGAKAEHAIVEKNYEKMIGDLSYECEELNKKNCSIHEILMNEGDPKLQAANMYCDKLEKEVSSLKSVLEMQQSDLKEFRCQKTLMAKVTEDLSTAKARIKKLQAKNEDLQALVAQKVENERALKKENQKLQEGYERGEKLMKRVSMENEGLQWRLRQSREFSASFNVTEGGTETEQLSMANNQSSYFWDNEGSFSHSARSKYSPAKSHNGAGQSNYSSRSNSPSTGPHCNLRTVRSSPIASGNSSSNNGVVHQLGRPLSVPNHHSTPQPTSHLRGGGGSTQPTLSLSDDESSTDWRSSSKTPAVVMRKKSRPRITVSQPTPGPRSAPPSMSSSLVAPDGLDSASSVSDVIERPSSPASDQWPVTNGSRSANGNVGSSDDSDQCFYGKVKSAGGDFEEIWKSLHCRSYTPDSPSPDRFTLESPDNGDDENDDDEGSCDHIVEEMCYALTDTKVTRIVHCDVTEDDIRSEPDQLSVDDCKDDHYEVGNDRCASGGDDGNETCGIARQPTTQREAAIVNGSVGAHDGTTMTLSDLQDLTEEMSRTSTSADDLLDQTADSSVDVPMDSTLVLDDGNSPGTSPKKTTTTLVIVYRKSRHSPDSSRGSSPAPQLLETPVTSDGSDSMTSSTDSSPRTSPPLEEQQPDEGDSSQPVPSSKTLQMLEHSLFASIHSPRVSAGESMMVLEERCSTASSSSSSREQPASLLCDPAHALLKRALQDHLQLCCDNGHGSSCGSSCCGASCSDFRGSVESCNTRGEPDSPPAGLSKPDTPESSQAVLPTDSTNIDLSWSDEDLPSETEV